MCHYVFTPVIVQRENYDNHDVGKNKKSHSSAFLSNILECEVVNRNIWQTAATSSKVKIARVNNYKAFSTQYVCIANTLRKYSCIEKTEQ